MQISKILYSLASWLENPSNEAFLLADKNDECLEVTAKTCIAAAEILKTGANELCKIESDKQITPDLLDDFNEIITAFDASDNEDLRKHASVLEEILLTIANPKFSLNEKKAAEENKIKNIREELNSLNKIHESEKAIEDSKMTKDFDILEAPLSSRYCPDHSGVPVRRIEDGIFQCDLDKKIYNFYTGYTNLKGEKIPGGDISNQSKMIQNDGSTIFDDRDGRLNSK